MKNTYFWVGIFVGKAVRVRLVRARSDVFKGEFWWFWACDAVLQVVLVGWQCGEGFPCRKITDFSVLNF